MLSPSISSLFLGTNLATAKFSSLLMPFDRSPGRNVHFYDASSPDIVLGGLIQNGSVTEANFLDMCEILLVTETPYQVRERDSRQLVTRINTPLEPGHYDIYCDSKC